jgi:hypothetical protein
MKNNMRHLMVDLETMSDKSFGAILSISAVQFDLETGETGAEFHTTATLKSNLEAGLKVDSDTIMWWLIQNEDARRRLWDGEKASKPIGLALYDFRKFIESLHAADLQMWGNSNRFEYSKLEDAYRVFKQELPWKHTLERDVRTIVSFAPQFKKEEPFTGVKHYGIDDCKHQIKYVVKTFKFIKSGGMWRDSVLGMMKEQADIATGMYDGLPETKVQIDELATTEVH